MLNPDSTLLSWITAEVSQALTVVREQMAKFGADYMTNPATQIRWGLDYIRGRYGTPCSAWSHSQRTGWY